MEKNNSSRWKTRHIFLGLQPKFILFYYIPPRAGYHLPEQSNFIFRMHTMKASSFIPILLLVGWYLFFLNTQSSRCWICDYSNPVNVVSIFCFPNPKCSQVYISLDETFSSLFGCFMISRSGNGMASLIKMDTQNILFLERYSSRLLKNKWILKVWHFSWIIGMLVVSTNDNRYKTIHH